MDGIKAEEQLSDLFSKVHLTKTGEMDLEWSKNECPDQLLAMQVRHDET